MSGSQPRLRHSPPHPRVISPRRYGAPITFPSVLGAPREPSRGPLGETVAIKESFANREPLGRLADPRETADGIMFLAGPQSYYITGSQLVVDGGQRRELKEPLALL